MYNIKNFVLFGDSITQKGYECVNKGWVALFSEKYIRKVDVINRGFSGYSTHHAIELFPKLFSKENCKDTLLMTIFLGANDSSLNPIQSLTGEEYGNNIRKLINLSLETFPENCPVIVITPPPCYSKRRNGDLGYTDHVNKRTEEFRNICLKTTQEFSNNSRVFSIDIWNDILGETWDPESEEFDKTIDPYLEDGLHLSDKGNELLYNKLINLIEGKLPHLIADDLPMFGPYWRNINPKDLKNSF